jgi:hypothetical protein
VSKASRGDKNIKVDRQNIAINVGVAMMALSAHINLPDGHLSAIHPDAAECVEAALYAPSAPCLVMLQRVS